MTTEFQNLSKKLAGFLLTADLQDAPTLIQFFKGINKKTRVIRTDTRFSPQCALHQKPGFPRAHPGI
jgi:hypothetical protein